LVKYGATKVSEADLKPEFQEVPDEESDFFEEDALEQEESDKEMSESEGD
jgi:hypothetical protein